MTETRKDGAAQLSVESLRKKLGRQLVLRDLSLEVKAGERVWIAGDNGSGKSTLFRVMAGVLRPDSGRVRLDGKDLAKHRQERVHIGYVPERADPPEHLSVEELLSFVASVKGCEPVSNAVAQTLGLHRLFAKRIGELSLGQRRRACLAAAFTGKPKLLLLDEPSNGLDRTSIAGLGELLQSTEATLVMACHDSAFAESVATRRHDLAQVPSPELSLEPSKLE